MISLTDDVVIHQQPTVGTTSSLPLQIIIDTSNDPDHPVFEVSNPNGSPAMSIDGNGQVSAANVYASNLGTASALASDTDTALAANSDSRIATQKATKAYADTKAPIASPTLTGVPTAPTAAANTNTTQIATTAYSDTGDALKLAKASNLSDLASASTARTNLGLGTLATVSSLTGPITSTGAATSVASQTGAGTKFVMDTAPTIQTSLSVAGPLTLTGAASTVKERGRSVAVGDWTAFTPAVTASTGSIAGSGPQAARYMLIGTTLFINFFAASTYVLSGGPAATISFTVPGGFTVASRASGFLANLGANAAATWDVTSGTTTVSLNSAVLAGGSWPNGIVSWAGNMVIEIQ